MFAIMCDLGFIGSGRTGKNYSFVPSLAQATLFSTEGGAQRFINQNPELYKHSPSIVEALKS